MSVANGKSVMKPKFTTGNNGEKDGPIYQQRLETLRKLVKDVLRDENVSLFMHDSTVTTDEFNRALLDENVGKGNVFNISGILDEPRLGLKSQIHIPFDSGRVPEWYNENLARKLTPYALYGFSVFTTQSLTMCIKSMRSEKEIRVKRGAGTAGEDQIILRHPFHQEEIPEGICKDIRSCGVVVEKNVVKSGKRTYSFTSFFLPQGAFISIGLILSRENPVTGESSYNGTTCLVTKEETAHKNLKLDYKDPVFGILSLSSDELAEIRKTGEQIASIYRKEIGNHPRVNFDLLLEETKTGNRYVLVDTSLRLGGNSWCEVKGAQRLLQDANITVCMNSIRVFAKKDGEKGLYKEQQYHIAEDADTIMFSMMHQNRTR